MNEQDDRRDIVTVVIVSHNSRRFLRRCLDAVRKSTAYPLCEVVLVDNASSDGTVSMIQRSYDWVRVIKNRENRGFSFACNQGLSAANGDFVLFLNPDIELEKDAVTRMVGRMKRSDGVGILGGLVFDASGRPQHSARREIPSIGSAFFYMTGLSRFLPASSRYNRYAGTGDSAFDERDVGAVSGSFLMAPVNVLREVGGFDEDFFLYGEDMDLCLRVKESGYRVIYYPVARAVHHHRTSTRKAPLRSTYHFYRSMAKFFGKHHRQGVDRLLVPVVSLSTWILMVAQLLFGQRVRLTGGVVRVERRCLRVMFILLDLAAVTGSWFMAIYLRFGEMKTLPPFRDYRSYILFLVILMIVTYGSMVYLRAYRIRPRAAGTALKSTLLVFVVLNLIFFYSRTLAFSRLTLVYFSALLFLSLLLWRLVFHLLAVSHIGRSLYRKRIVIAGSGELTRLLVRALRQEENGYQVIGLIGSDEPSPERLCEKPYLGNYPEVRDIVENFAVDEIVVVDDDEEGDSLLLSGYLRGCRVRVRLLGKAAAGDLERRNRVELGNLPLLS